MNKKIFTIITILVIIVLAWFLFFRENGAEDINEPIQTINEEDYQNEESLNDEIESDIPVLSVVANNLETPWSIVKLPNDSFLLTEREGQIRLIEANGSSEIIEVIDEARESGEGGLLGMTLHPQFEDNNLIYLYYTYKNKEAETVNKVIRAKYVDNSFIDIETIIDNIPGAMYHNGGRIKFGPDNNLYITAGDGQRPEKAQDINYLGGKILRLNEEGGVIEDNLYDNEVYSYGHRNPQGIAWDSEGNLWSTEHGRSATDELNLIRKGANYGWPIIVGSEEREDMESPAIHSGVNETWAPSGAAYYDNNIFFVGLRGNTLYQANIEDIDNIEISKHFAGEFGRLRDVIVDNGILYFISNNTDGRGEPEEDDDKLYRLDLERFLGE
ncbi:PQQ-dependent sugar dehydrogenase [Patescibacteria group bacterium]|nr:PQQ-dependent sugar dehydrogenase [Patescibacteria group bacterium]